MLVVTLNSENRICDIFDTDVFVDEGAETYEITPAQHHTVWGDGGGHPSHWRLVGGELVHDPLPLPPPYEPPTSGVSVGAIPGSIL